MVATGDAVVTIWQFVDKGGLPKAWEQGLVILAVLWFSAAMSMLRLRMTQSYANVAVVFYGAAIFVIGLAGILWLIGDGHSATGGWGTGSNWSIHAGQWTWFGFVILALLGIEVPLNMGVEIVHLPLDDTRDDAGAPRLEERRRDDRHPQRCAGRLLGVAWVCRRHRPRADLVLRLEHHRLQLLVLAAALRVRAGAADASAARTRERQDEGAGLRDRDADGALVDLRRRD